MFNTNLENAIIIDYFWKSQNLGLNFALKFLGILHRKLQKFQNTYCVFNFLCQNITFKNLKTKGQQ